MLAKNREIKQHSFLALETN